MADGFDQSAVWVREVQVRRFGRMSAVVGMRGWIGIIPWDSSCSRPAAGCGLAGSLAVASGLAVGAFQCGPRDRWLHWIGNHTRFLVLPEASGIANRPLRVLGQSRQRRSGDGLAPHGHPLERV